MNCAYCSLVKCKSKEGKLDLTSDGSYLTEAKATLWVYDTKARRRCRTSLLVLF